MPIRLRDRVKQGTVSAGTGTVTLSTSFGSFQDLTEAFDGACQIFTLNFVIYAIMC